MSGSTISADSGSRLASFVGARREGLAASIVGAVVLPRPGWIAANTFAIAFLDRLATEARTGEREPLDAWVAETDADDRAECARIVTLACSTVGAEYVERFGRVDDVVPYLALRASELEAAFRTETLPALARLVDPRTLVDRDDVVASLLCAIEARDPATCEHSRAVGIWSGRMAKALGMNPVDQAQAAVAGTLHDVGKIATPTEVLLKAGALNDDEWETMRAHSRIGAKMLERIPSLRELAPVVRAHHERIDGGGYPDRLAGESIPFVARIVSVADSFHAMISKRPYRQAMPVARALEELRRGHGTQWDGTVVDTMLGIVQPAGIPRALGIASELG